MSYSIANITSDLASIFHGTNTNDINNINGLFNRAARQLLLDVDPQELIRIAPFTTPVYNQVYDYALPVDIKGNGIIDIFPQVNRNGRDVYLQDYNQAFDVNKILTSQDQFTILFNSGVKTIRMASPFLNNPTVLNYASNITANGTWTTGGGATGLIVDNVNFIDGGGSLEFNLSAGQSTGYLENSTMSPLNLTNNLNQATNFLYSYLPTATSVSGVELRLGSSSTNYYSLNATATQQNNAFSNGWNLLQYPWANMAVVGAPNIAAINYIRVTWTYDSTLQTAVRLNDLLSILGTILNVEYYSKYMFRTLTGVWQETTTATTDLINLDTESYNIYLNQVAYLAAQQLQGLDAMFFDANFFLQAYQNGVQRYKSIYKSQRQTPQSTYYSLPRSQNRLWGRTRWV